MSELREILAAFHRRPSRVVGASISAGCHQVWDRELGRFRLVDPGDDRDSLAEVARIIALHEAACTVEPEKKSCSQRRRTDNILTPSGPESGDIRHDCESSSGRC